MVTYIDQFGTEVHTDDVVGTTKKGLPIYAGQHCTSKKCPYTFSHTAGWCGYPQKRRCNCAFESYEEES